MLTITDIAKALEIDRRLVARDSRRGMPLESVDAARAWRAANVRPRAVSRPKSKRKKTTRLPPNPYQDARTRLAITEAQEAELRLLERKGVLRHEATLRAELGRRLAGLKDAILQMPSRLQSVVAAESDEAKCHDLIQDECFGILSLIAEV